MAIDLEEIKERVDKNVLYSIKETSDVLNVPVGTVKWWLYTKKMPKKKIGKRVYISGLDILKFYGVLEEDKYGQGR